MALASVCWYLFHGNDYLDTDVGAAEVDLLTVQLYNITEILPTFNRCALPV